MPKQVTVQELSSFTDLPQTFKDVILLSPGLWNGNTYTSNGIIQAFNSTNWANEKNSFLYLDHQDTFGRGIETWAGFVKNIRTTELVNESNSEIVLMGDLEVWHPWAAFYLSEAKAKFGVSATLTGRENSENGEMENFKFMSFSIVADPACKPAMINLSDGEKISVVTLGSRNQLNTQSNPLTERTKTVPNDDIISKLNDLYESISVKYDDLIEMKGGKKDMKENELKKKNEEEDEEEEKKKKKKDMSDEAEEDSEDESKEELATSLKGIEKKLNQLISLMIKSQEKKLEEEESKEDEEKPEEEPSKDEPKEESKEDESLKEELRAVRKELQALNKEPDRKTISVSLGNSSEAKDSNEGMLHFLAKNLR